jgi:benzylsuccinate CoA-transferase BbsF subunit
MIPEAIMEYAWHGTQPERNGNRDPWMVPHGIFRCAGEQRWVAVVARDDAEWQRLARAIGRNDLAEHPELATLSGRRRAVERIEQDIEEWTLQRTPMEVTQVLQAAGVPAFPCCDSRDLAEDEHLREEGFFVELEHPEVGRKLHLGIPWRMSGTPCSVTRPAPLLGEHTEFVLRNVLGYDDERIQNLLASGALR